ncbi:hypothetical protein F5888DRAFT_33647 [Russula emetica]|nr:hypothetical protein F5888DRAFT_33647 [Russula emetica]
MLSWFTRNTSKPSKPPPPSEQQQPRTEVAPSLIPKEKPSSQEATTHPIAAPAAVIDAPPAATAPTSEQPQKGVFTAALNTPHDAVLAELHGHPTGHDLPARANPNATPSTSALGMQSIDTLPPAASDTPGSIATSTSPPPESLHDPFTGMTIGILSPISPARNNSSSEELWAHLSRIRSLQADVARLHLTMEGIGLGDPDASHLRSTSPRPVGERLEDDENIDADGGGSGSGGVEAEKRRAREFERSEQRFDRRKEEIGQIMSKLDEVSQALAAFHALDTPVFNPAVAATSRPTTVSSTPVRHHPTSRPPDLHRVSLEASARGREDIFVDSPLVSHEPLSSLEEPETRVEHAPPDASVV